jgi:putative zinc finger/helix-turn-helix YgiT family protein
MTTIECADCGGSANVEHNGSYAFKESGLSNLTLEGIDIIHCEGCKSSTPIIPRVNDLMSTIAVALIMKPSRLRGEEIRFLRKYLQMTQAEFSTVLDVDKTSVSKWENDEDKVGAQSDRLVRMVCLELCPELKEKSDLHAETIKKLLKEIDNDGRAQSVCIREVSTAAFAYQYAYC